MLMASELLRNRLKAVEEARAASKLSDTTPTLLDIEKTHILFTNAHFKPFAAIGFEYNKTNPQSGNSQLGSQVTFSIPQFGDFFHDMVLYVKLKQPVMTAAPSPDTVSNEPLMRWCAYPGERLVESVEFEVNGNPLDKYYDHNVNFHREFSVAPNKKAGWDRCVGQEEPEEGFLDQPNWADSGVAPEAILHRLGARAFSGDQTPTGQKNVNVYKEMLVPLNFWCNRDVRLSVPSVAIPYGQRFIKVNLAAGEKLVGLVPRGSGTWSAPGGSLNYDNMLRSIELYINNIFVNPEVHDIFIKRIGFTLIRVHRVQTINADKSSAEILLQQLKWPVESLFVGMKMKDYNSSDPALQREHLDKWHTFSKITSTERATQGWRSAKVKLVNASKAVPTGTTALNLSGTQATLTTSTPVTAYSVAALADYATGDLITFTTSNGSGIFASTTTLEVSNILPADGTNGAKLVFKQTSAELTAAGAIAGTVTGNVSVSRPSSAEATAHVEVAEKTVDTVTIKAHGIPIYNNFNQKFYNAYLPYHFGGPNVNVPKDSGALFIPFCLYPGSYQPSGHINVSRAREFYLEYTSSVIDTNTQGTLVVAASAINFLLISDGSAKLLWHSDKINFIASTIVLCNTPFIRESLDIPQWVC